MSNKKRYLYDQIIADLSRKMVFLGGPRQVGKTTLAKSVLHHFNSSGYLNWDIVDHKDAILTNKLPNTVMWVFDELHKYSNWRNFLKGVFDNFKDEKKIMVTGSARLDYYKGGGDSLQGRYHYLRLNPLSVAEIKAKNIKEVFDLFKLGGFPEQFFTASEIEAKRWSREYRSRLIQEDLVSLENIHDISKIELLMLRLPELVGSPLSINSLTEDLNASHKAVTNWIEILQRLYGIFRITAFGSPLIKAVKKEQKHYHYDWTLIDNEGTRFKNFVACHLLKYVQYEQDTTARDLELKYFKDIEGREVDFIITEKNIPVYAIECKLSDKDISKHLRYFKNKFKNCKAMQLSLLGKESYVSADGIIVDNCYNFLKDLV